jgi:hypothetical protein
VLKLQERGMNMIETRRRPSAVDLSTTKYLRPSARFDHLNPARYSGSYSCFLPLGPSLVTAIRRPGEEKLKESRILRVTPIPPRVDNLLLVDVEYSCTSCDGFGVVRTTAVEWTLVKDTPRTNFVCRKCRMSRESR